MPRIVCLLFTVSVAMLGLACAASAQDYEKVARERARKISQGLSVRDEEARQRLTDLVANYYMGLNALEHSASQKKEHGAAINAEAERQMALWNAQQIKIQFVAQLATELALDEVEKVKDALTYGVLPLTYKGYQELYPDLTDEQKRQILAWLIEAREYAMTGGSSEEKHRWFGKYKGRINNYLAKAGYDAKKAEKELQERRRAARN
jgi:hypothetical protein